jgi:hypothetical protein
MGVKHDYGFNRAFSKKKIPWVIESKKRKKKPTFLLLKFQQINHLGGGLMVRVWDQEVCSLCDLRFEPCGYSYDGH